MLLVFICRREQVQGLASGDQDALVRPLAGLLQLLNRALLLVQRVVKFCRQAALLVVHYCRFWRHYNAWQWRLLDLFLREVVRGLGRVGGSRFITYILKYVGAAMALRMLKLLLTLLLDDSDLAHRDDGQ